MSPPLLDDRTRREIQWDCEQLILSFYGLLDEKRYDELADLFLPTGAWVRLGEELIGPARIKQAMGQRDTWITAHLVSNLRIQVIDADHAESIQYVTLYRHEDHDPAQGPAPVVLPLGILRHTDKLERAGGAWRFKRKASKAVMVDRHRVTHYDKPRT